MKSAISVRTILSTKLVTGIEFLVQVKSEVLHLINQQFDFVEVKLLIRQKGLVLYRLISDLDILIGVQLITWLNMNGYIELQTINRRCFHIHGEGPY